MHVLALLNDSCIGDHFHSAICLCEKSHNYYHPKKKKERKGHKVSMHRGQRRSSCHVVARTVVGHVDAVIWSIVHRLCHPATQQPHRLTSDDGTNNYLSGKKASSVHVSSTTRAHDCTRTRKGRASAATEACYIPP